MNWETIVVAIGHAITGRMGPGQYLRLIEEGLTYSDVLLMLKWYKVLPR